MRGIDRTLEFAEYTEEERPIAIQVFGGDAARMAAGAQILESLGADIVDVNMGCPVPKIAKHNAGCSLMRDPAHAASIVRAMTDAVKVPVTVKMRAGWNEDEINAPLLARHVEDAGAAAVTVHGRTAKQSYAGRSDWGLISEVVRSVRIPVFGSGDCIEPGELLGRVAESGAAGVLVGRGALRNPWIFAQADDLATGAPARTIPLEARGQFLLEYLDLLLGGRRGRGPGVPARAACLERARAGPRSRPLGHQQAPRPRVLVHEGARQRVPFAAGRQCGRVTGRASGDHPRLLRRVPRAATLEAVSSTPSVQRRRR